jgi:glycosyltransferase involved in cell wall biosynthesis
MKVSVIICTYNYGRFLGQCLQSVFAQTRPVDEVIVVDDGSEDETADVVRGFSGVRYVHQPNAGKTAAFNHGFALCTGDIICHLDADDVWHARKLERVLPKFIKTQVGGVTHDTFSIDADGKRLMPRKQQPRRCTTTLDFHQFLLSLLVYPPTLPRRKTVGMPNTLVVRRDAIVDTFPLPGCLGLSVDMALLLLAARKKLSYVPTTLAGYRWHGANYYLANRDRGVDEMLELYAWAQRLASLGRSEAGLLGLLRSEREAYRAMRHGGGAWGMAVRALTLPFGMAAAGIVPGWKHLALPIGCLIGVSNRDQFNSAPGPT